MQTDLNSIFGEFLKCGGNKKTTCTYTYFSIFKGQTKVFTLRECAQSISRIKLPLIGSFLLKKIFSPKWSQNAFSASDFLDFETYVGGRGLKYPKSDKVI